MGSSAHAHCIDYTHSSPVSSLTQRTQRNRLRLAGNRKVRKKRNKRNKITQSKTLRKTRFPSKRNARNHQPIGMVDLNSKAANQMIALFAVFVYATHASHVTQSLAFLAVFVYTTHATQRTHAIGCVACVALSWKPGFSPLLPLTCSLYKTVATNFETTLWCVCVCVCSVTMAEGGSRQDDQAAGGEKKLGRQKRASFLYRSDMSTIHASSSQRGFFVGKTTGSLSAGCTE